MPVYSSVPAGIARNYSSDAPLTASTTIGSANDCRYHRSLEAQVISKIAIHVVVQSGNLSVAVFAADATGIPSTRTATSGAVAVPAPGYAELSLGASVSVRAGDFLAISCDNNTATFIGLGLNGLTSDLFQEVLYVQATAHPAPASTSIGSLLAQSNRSLAIRGVT